MKFRKTAALMCGLSMFALQGFAQSDFQLVTQEPANAENQPAPCHPVPAERQVLWNETEFYAFFHYGMNTFTNAEWGYGNEDESKYAPLGKPDPEQWLTAVKAAGMKGGIAVVKHHDGFCLWPTATTTHSIANAGNENGKTNIPELFAQAARKLDMKYGFYVSPWDRNSAYYGTDKYVTEVFLKQCLELAEYGSDQFEMWFDGANGGDGYYGGKNTTISVDKDIYYDIPNLRARVHQIAPNCVMWGVGDEARWIGNESGYAGNTNWAMGSGESGDINGWYWKPGESDAKATSAGWFWHSTETMKSAATLFQMYLETVGRNATLILNCPPNNYGVLPTATVTQLEQLGKLLQTRLGTDLAPKAKIEVSEARANGATRTYVAQNMIDGDKDTYWAANDGSHSATITLTWDETQTIHYLMMQEYIRLGQRIKDFKVEYMTEDGAWKELAPSFESTTVGYKRIMPLNGSTSNYGSGYKAKALRVTILDSRACPTLHTLSVF